MFDFFFKLGDFINSGTSKINEFFKVLLLLLGKFADTIEFVNDINIDIIDFPFKWILPFLMFFLVVRFAHGFGVGGSES